ncbi:hypothetical protein G2W53_008769 [Senna tora]|uniref:Uncharacterized protein n=1 Tax=Senna tora TaxID=362788 RepID=A0A835C911_9FABA|nr:hypothetical protein G2W53_008769 [Senna tora]
MIQESYTPPSRTHTTCSPNSSFSSPSSQTPHHSHSILQPHAALPADYANRLGSSSSSSMAISYTFRFGNLLNFSLNALFPTWGDPNTKAQTGMLVTPFSTKSKALRIDKLAPRLCPARITLGSLAIPSSPSAYQNPLLLRRLSGVGFSPHDIDPLVISGRPPPDDVDFAAAQGGADLVGGDGDVADPVGLAVPTLPGHGTKEKSLGNADAGGCVEEGGDGVIGGVVELDLMEEGGFTVAAGAAEAGVGVVVEGVVGGLNEVAASEDEVAEAEVERMKQGFPVVGAQELRPCGVLGLVMSFFSHEIKGLQGKEGQW